MYIPSDDTICVASFPISFEAAILKKLGSLLRMPMPSTDHNAQASQISELSTWKWPMRGFSNFSHVFHGVFRNNTIFFPVISS